MSKNKYLVYTVINKDISVALSTINWKNNYSFEINKIIKIDINNQKSGQWYAHRLFRPVALNFCTAIKREDLIELNGFDERYAFGAERDDVEFLERIKRKKMNIVFVDNILVIHQSHNICYDNNENYSNLRDINHSLYAKTTAVESIIKANPDKIVLQ